MSPLVFVFVCLASMNVLGEPEEQPIKLEQESQQYALPDSAIGLWLQQQKMVKRVCHRDTKEKVHTELFVDAYPVRGKHTPISPFTGTTKRPHCRTPISRLNEKQQRLNLILENTGTGQTFQVANCKTSLVDATREEEHSRGDQEVCPGTDLCIASLSEVTTIRTLTGVRDVTSAVSCTCVPRERDCQRISSQQVFFNETKFETRVDVGQCIGKCRLHGSREIECKPTSLKTVTVIGPNGAKCVEVIRSCACERKCYRISHNEAFAVQHNNSTLTKIIDVGRCVGKCSGHTKGECLYWINNRDGSGSRTRHCAVRTKTRPKQCYPESTSEQTVGGKTVSVIESCACR
ncbi:uncharacterized protein LOC110045776 [Orbicella faveolata]|uniref:uncharacterized protein LOC110045776 n=1 Tax=Orbicella faveolata TaxID=48498 RepID=UPI0009E3ED22|nr:uncharacterized protein LOC110045776 [Orbicella faveolata]